MSSYRADRLDFRPHALALLLIGCVVLAGWLYLQGSVIVRDADGVVEAVFLRDSVDQVRARRFPGRVHAITVVLEGEAVIRCRNGQEISLGYITGAFHLSQTVRAADCVARLS